MTKTLRLKKDILKLCAREMLSSFHSASKIKEKIRLISCCTALWEAAKITMSQIALYSNCHGHDVLPLNVQACEESEQSGHQQIQFTVCTDKNG